MPLPRYRVGVTTATEGAGRQVLVLVFDAEEQVFVYRAKQPAALKQQVLNEVSGIYKHVLIREF